MNNVKLFLLGGLVAVFAGSAVASGDINAGKEKSAMCVSCHGADGNSTDPQFPRLAGQHADYLERSLKDYREGTRKNPIMAGFAGGLNDADIANLAAYYSSQTGLVTPTLPRRLEP